MLSHTALWIRLLLAICIAFVISFAATPIAKSFAINVGAIDVPGEARRVHDHPIPRMGGLAIFIGFLISVVLFVNISRPVRGILLGTVIMVIVGIIDDIVSLRAWQKFLAQIVAAVVAVLHGVVIQVIANPNVFHPVEGVSLGFLAVPLTILWIVGITNSVNLIDGLDGLACGVSTIASLTMFAVALLVSEVNVALILAALMGACLGFIPYNFNPAKIFMGDTGALLLGYVLSTVSVIGMFKFYAVVTFVVPIMALAVPLCDTLFAFFRRLLHGQNPMRPDRGHFHHRLIDMGLSQKQAVAILYSISAVLGLYAVVITAEGRLRVWLLALAIVIAIVVGIFITRTLRAHDHHHHHPDKEADTAPPEDHDAEA